MTNTNNLNIPLVVQSQAQKEVTINQAISMLEALQNRGVVDKDLSSPPLSPAEGDAYIVSATATGAWAGKENNVAYYNGVWKFIAPNEGLIIWVNDEGKIYYYSGSAWVAYSDNLNNIAMLGVNDTADSTNKLSVSSDAILFSHNGTDIKTKLNKNSSGNTASFLFQNTFSGRAEFGLVGDDDFTLKTSADGSAWTNSFKASKTDASVDFLAGIKFAGGTKLSNYEEGTFTPTLGGTTAGTATYSTQVGNYTRIGNRLFFDIRIVVASLTGSSGSLRIGGLPYTIGTGNGNGAAIGYYNNSNLGSNFGIVAHPSSGNTYIVLSKTSATGAPALLQADISASFEMRVGGSYKI